jgi:hypothetical protein
VLRIESKPPFPKAPIDKTIVGKEQSMKQAFIRNSRLNRGKLRTTLTLCLGGAVCGGYVGVPLGGLVGLVYGLFVGEPEFAFAGAVFGFLFFAVIGIMYGAVLGIRGEAKPRRASVESKALVGSTCAPHNPRLQEQPQEQNTTDRT